MKSKLTTMTIILALIASTIYAQNIPQKISFQGRLIDANTQKPVTAEKNFTFKIGDWIEEHKNVQVSNGLYSAILGSINPIPLTLFNDWQANMKILVDGKEMAPDIGMVSVPYAFQAASVLDGSIGTAKLNFTPLVYNDNKVSFDHKTITGLLAWPQIYDFSENRGIRNKILNCGDLLVNAIERGFKITVNRPPKNGEEYLKNMFKPSMPGIVKPYWTDVNEDNPVIIEIEWPEGKSCSSHALLLVPGAHSSYGRNTMPINYKIETFGYAYKNCTPGNGHEIKWIAQHDTVNETNTFLKLVPLTKCYGDGIYGPGVEKLSKLKITVTKSGDLTFSGCLAISNIILYERYIGNGRFTGYSLSSSGDTMYGKLNVNIGNGDEIYNGLCVYKKGQCNRGLSIMVGKDGADGAKYDIWNGALGSWYGIGFYSTYDNETRGIFNTRTGDFSIKGNFISEGKIGIGTSEPNYKLHVNGSAYCTSGTWASSDIRYKKNITPIQTPLQKVTQLKGVNYEWKTEEYPEKNFSSGKQIGMIAQDVEKVIPEIVHTDNEGMKSISYDKITAVLVEAIKELKAENEQIKEILCEDRPNHKFCTN